MDRLLAMAWVVAYNLQHLVAVRCPSLINPISDQVSNARNDTAATASEGSTSMFHRALFHFVGQRDFRRTKSVKWVTGYFLNHTLNMSPQDW
jgi:hypothetical protein